MPDEVSVEDNLSQSESKSELTADEHQPVAAKDVEEVKEQPEADEESATESNESDAAAAEAALDDAASTEPTADPASAADGTAGESEPTDAGDAAPAATAESAAAENVAQVNNEESQEQQQSNTVSLNVDTTVEEEPEAEIAAPEPVTQFQPLDQPPAAAPAQQSRYGSQHNWCPLCSRQPSQTTESAEGKSDALSLSWVEQSIFACNSEHHSNITAFKSLLPPASSLPPFIPTSVSVIGPPLSGRTSLAKRLCSALNLSYLSVPDILAALIASSHPLSTQLSASLPSPPPLSLLLDCVEAALCRLAEANEGTRGWVLDGLPNTREEAEAMQQRGLLPRQCINLTITKKGGHEAEVAEVERRWRARAEQEQKEREEQERAAAEKAAAAVLEEQRKKKEQEAAVTAEDGVGNEGNKEAEGAEADQTEPAAEETETKAEEAESAVQEEAEAEQETEQAEESTSGETQFAANANMDPVGSPVSSTVTADPSDTVLVALSTSAEGEVQVTIESLQPQQPSPSSPAVSVDLLTPFLASLRASLTAEQWSDQLTTFSQLLDYLRSERLLTTIAVPTSLWSAQRQAGEFITTNAVARTAHLQALSAGLPSSLFSLPFSSSRLSTDLSGFGLYSAVRWHDEAALYKLQANDINTRWVQHKGLLYALDNEQEEQHFLSDPARYHDSSSFPTSLPTLFNDDAGAGHLVHPLRYTGYCPVSIQRQRDGEALYVMPGSSQYSALYQSRLFRFSSAEALQLFLTFPTRYSNLTLPSPPPLPLHLQPLPLAPSTVHSFLTVDLSPRLTTALTALAGRRHALLYPGLSIQQTALIWLALQLKGDLMRLAVFEAECELGREIAKEAEGGDSGAEKVDSRHAAYDAIQSEVDGKDWQSVQKYVQSKFFPLV